MGAIDGKHFRIEYLPNTGSTYFSDTSYFPFVLMACVYADGLFTTIGIETIRRNSDGVIFRTSNLGRASNLGVLELPPYRLLPLRNKENIFSIIYNY